MKKYLFFLFVITLFCSCDSSVVGILRGTSARANTRYSQSMEFNANHPYPVFTVQDGYVVYVCGDTHVVDSSKCLTQFILDYKSDTLCPFAIHLGDLTNAKDCLPAYFAIAAKNPAGYVPGSDTLFYTLGNHDIYYAQWDSYRQYVPSTTYYFSTQTAAGEPLDFYICIDSAEGTLGTDALAWLRQILSEAHNQSWRHIIVFTHTNFFRHDFSQEFTSNFAMEETYELTYLFKQYGVEVVLSGHDHYREMVDYSGVNYITLDALKDNFNASSYLKMTMSDHILYDWVK